MVIKRSDLDSIDFSDIGTGESIESIRCRIDLRGASPEAIVRDAEQARHRAATIVNARYLGVSIGYHYFAVATPNAPAT